MSDNIARRALLRAMGATVMAAGGFGASQGQTQQPAPWSSGTEPPKLKAPPNACDCHMHIYDSRFPVAPNAKLRPPDATVDDYRLLQKRIGTTRNVVVTPSTYGTDNSCTLDAIAKLGTTARGVAVVDTSVADAELKRLDGLGMRGIRFNLVQSGATTIDMLEPLSKRVNDLGWHVQIHMLGDQIVEVAEPSATAALADRLRPYGAHSRAGGRRSSGVRIGAEAHRSAAGPGSSFPAPTRIRRAARPPMATSARSPRLTSKPRRSEWSGAATGRTRPKRPTPSPTTRSCSTSWPTGRRTRRSAIASWSTTRRRCTGLRSAETSIARSEATKQSGDRRSLCSPGLTVTGRCISRRPAP